MQLHQTKINYTAEETINEMATYGMGETYANCISNEAVPVKVAQSCPTLCNPMECSLLGSSVHGILQAGILEWVAVPFSKGSSQTGIKSRSPALQADSLLSEPPGKP